MRLALASLVLVALLPLVAATDVCVPTCAVATHQLTGFVPAALVVASGSTVAWSELDGLHVAAARDFCFQATIPPGGTGSARFVVQDGALYAAGGADPLERCTTAAMLPDGSAVLEYYCPVHPSMRPAQLVVK